MKFLLEKCSNTNKHYLLEAREDELRFKQWITDNGSEDDVAEIIVKKFISLKNRIKSPKNDFYWWIKNSDPTELISFIGEIEETQSENQKRIKAKQGAKLIYDKDGWKIYKVETYDAARYYGSGTKWCITGRYGNGNDEYDNDGEYYFHDYLKRGVKGYYFIIHGNEKWCYLEVGEKFPDDIFWDAEDNGREISDPNIPKKIPQAVLDALPGFKERIEYERNRDTFVVESDEFWGGRWSNFTNTDLDHDQVNLVFKEGVTYVPEYFFANTNFENIYFSSTIGKIGEKAFYKCFKLKHIYFPDDSELYYIGESAFEYCTLNEVVFPTSIDIIDDRAFAKCTYLDRVKFPTSCNLTQIGKDAFKQCLIDSIDFPENLEYIGERAFSFNNLNKIQLNDSLTDIGDYAFEYNDLESITIPKNVQYIGSKIFLGNQYIRIKCKRSKPSNWSAWHSDWDVIDEDSGNWVNRAKVIWSDSKNESLKGKMKFKLLESYIKDEYERLTVDELLERTDSAGEYSSDTDEWVKALRKAARKLGVHPWTNLIILKTSDITDLYYYIAYNINFSTEQIGDISYIAERVGRNNLYVYFKSDKDLNNFINYIEKKIEEDEI